MRSHRSSFCINVGTQVLVVIAWMLIASAVYAVPYRGDTFTYYQPDGATFQIRLYGDEFYAVAETLDGYTIVRDPDTGMFCYARLSNDGNSLVSTGVSVGKGSAAPVSLQKGVRISQREQTRQSRTAREKFGVDERGMLLPELRNVLRPEASINLEEDEIQPGPPSSTTTGTRVGLVLLAQFPDLPDDVVINRSQVDAYINDPNYTGFDNATSVYGYFNIQSDGTLRYNCIVTAYFTAANNRDYYTDTTIAYGTRAKQLINEGLTVLKANGFDFTKCDADFNGVLDGVNIFYAGPRVNSWSQGLWPHKWSSSWSGLSGEGVSTSFQYQITNMGAELTLGTFCHENGHMICGFPDLYAYDSNAAKINNFSLMSNSGTKHPVNVDAYLKIHAGWADVVDITSASHLRGAVEVDKNTFYRYKNPSESREYFILSMRRNTGYEGVYGGASSAANPTNGLVIWHAREHGSNTYSSIYSADSPFTDYTTPFELMVVEANPSSSTTPWYDDPNPRSNDGYHGGDISQASDSTSPALKFWSTATGRTITSSMHVHTISDQDDTMTFTIGTGAITGSPNIGLTSTSLAPESEFGSDAPPQTFAVFNSGAGTLNYTITDNVSWLSVNPASGSAITEADLVTVIYDTDGLTNGTYHGTITITDGGATNNPETIAVTLKVNGQPTIGLNSTTVTKTMASGLTGTGTVVISNAGGGTLNYTLSESAAWLSLATTSGTVVAEEDTIDLTFDASGMYEGSYMTDITITSTNATNPSQTVTVTMNLTGEVLVVSPHGGETIWQGNKHDISWGTGGGVTGNVKIDLYKGGTLDSTIVASTPNDNMYVWDIPAGQALGSDYKIRISSVDDAGIYAESEANFSVAILPTLVSIPYVESFESGFGDWNQDASDSMDWTQNSSGTPSSSTGPSAAQDGTFYIYTEASSPNYPSKSARLYCYFDLRTATAPLLSFYNHMYGSAMGSLDIRVSTDQEKWTNLFSRSGNQGNSWNQANVDLSAFAGRVIIMKIFGTTGSSYMSDMALDALSIAEATKTLTYSTDTFSEDSANDGSIANSITITLAGSTFTSTAVSGGHITAASVPSGLDAQFVRDSSSQITMTLTGNAANHENEDSILDLQVTFADGAFTGGGASTVTGNVTDLVVDYFETYGFSIDDPFVTEGDIGSATLQFTVSLKSAPGSTVTVDCATSNATAIAGVDYTATSNTLTFGATDTSKTFNVTVAGDYYDENDETLTVTLGNPTGGSTIIDSTGTGTITDDDTAGVTLGTISGDTTEAGGTATFTIVLDSRPTYNVTIGLSSDDPGEGTVLPTGVTFTSGDWDIPKNVTVTGVNDNFNDGNQVYNIVTAAATSSDPLYNGMDPADVSVTNMHTVNIYTVNASVDTHGTVDAQSLSVEQGSAASFTVTSGVGYVVNSTVGGNCPAGSWNGTIYTTGAVTEPCSVSFTHGLKSYTVHSSVLGGNGTINPAGDQLVFHGAIQQFNLKPDNGFQTQSVGGSCGGILSGNTFTTNTITSDCTVVAINMHTVNNYTVNASVDTHGTVDAQSLSVEQGSAASFTVTPGVGYAANSTVGGNCPAGSWNGTIYTTGAVTEPCSVSFTHSLKSYTVHSSVLGSNGTIDPAGDQLVFHGAIQQFILKPENGFQTQSVGGSCGGILSGNTFTTNTVTADCTVVAVFSDRFTLNVVLTGKGSGTVTTTPAGINCGTDCDELYDHSTPVTLIATPDTDSKFVGWSGDADCKDGSLIMTSNVYCTANFYRFPWVLFQPIFK